MIKIYDKFCKNVVYPSSTTYPSSKTYPCNPYKLYSTQFNSNGYGVLKDFISNPIITEVINGEYSLEFEYIKDGWLAEYIEEENVLKADHNGSEQLFRITYIEKNINTIKVLARHIIFDLVDNFVDDVYPISKTAQEGIQWILDRTQFAHGFSTWSDITDLRSARYVRKNLNEALFSADNSVLNTWGGEFQFDNLTLKLYSQRGADNNLNIRYGKNLTGIDFKLDMSTVATRIMPIGRDGLLLPEKYIDSTHIHLYKAPIIKKIEFDIGVDDDTTAEEAYDLLRAEVASLYASGIDYPKVSVKVDFIELSKVSEYSDYSAMESANIGDTVHIYISNLNIDTTARIVKTQYDCLLERFVKLELGAVTPNYINQTTTNIITELDNRVKTNQIISQINQTDESISISAEKVSLEGYTTINDGFSVDLEGNATMNNATINGSTLKLADNTEIVGGNGILTNLQYKNAGINPLGFRQISLEGVAFVYGFIELEAFIPANFTVREAYITLTVYKTLNQFLKDDVEFISTNEYGKVTNIKLYKVASSAEMVNSTEFGSFNFEMPTGTEISNAFAVGGYTNPTISGATVTSIDIKTSLSAGINSFYIATSDALPGDTDADATLAAQKTQLAIAILTIIGFTK